MGALPPYLCVPCNALLDVGVFNNADGLCGALNKTRPLNDINIFNKGY